VAPADAAGDCVVVTVVAHDSPMVFPADRVLSGAVRLYLWAMDTSLSHWDRMPVAHRSIKAFRLRDRNSVRGPCKCDCNWGSVSSVRLGSIETLGKLAVQFPALTPKEEYEGLEADRVRIVT